MLAHARPLLCRAMVHSGIGKDHQSACAPSYARTLGTGSGLGAIGPPPLLAQHMQGRPAATGMDSCVAVSVART